MGCGNWRGRGCGDDDCGDEGGYVSDKGDGEEDGGFHLLLLLSWQLQSLSRDGLRNQKNGEENIGVVEDCDER